MVNKDWNLEQEIDMLNGKLASQDIKIQKLKKVLSYAVGYMDHFCTVNGIQLKDRIADCDQCKIKREANEL